MVPHPLLQPLASRMIARTTDRFATVFVELVVGSGAARATARGQAALVSSFVVGGKGFASDLSRAFVAVERGAS